MRQRRTIVIAFFKYINQHTCFSVNIETLFHMVPKYNADKKTVVPRRDLGDVAAVHQIISIIKSTFALYSHATSLNRIEYSQVRNAAVSMILLKSALRANEVLNLEFGDIRESEFNNVLEISVKQGKGRKDRTVFAQKKDTQDAIDILRRHNESTFICQTYKHKKMSYQNLRASIEKFFEMHNVCVNGLHRFRHAYTGDMKNSGADPLFVKEQLGHTDFKTTQRYMQDDASERARILHDHLAKWKQL
jgi:integrase